MSAPNAALAMAFAVAGWSNHEVARRLNALAERRGHRGVAVDHTRVGRWVRRGEKPRPPVPELLAELLTEHLGQPYTPRLLGIGPARSVVVFLDEQEHHALALNAAAANMPVKHYIQFIVRNALAQPSRPELNGRPTEGV